MMTAIILICILLFAWNVALSYFLFIIGKLVVKCADALNEATRYDGLGDRGA